MLWEHSTNFNPQTSLITLDFISTEGNADSEMFYIETCILELKPLSDIPSLKPTAMAIADLSLGISHPKSTHLTV